MFQKLMNNFYYGKSGKGDFRKEDLPTTRTQLFWEMLRIRLSGLVRLNLMYAVVWLPAMVVLLLTMLGILNAAQPTEQAADLAANLRGVLMTTLLLLVPCITITGPVTAGVSYVTRNWARDEHAFVWADFRDAIKENWKQALPVSFITGLMPLLVYVSWIFYSTMAQSNPLMMIPQYLVLFLGLVWALSVSYAHPLLVSYQLPLKGILKNALLLGIGRLPISLGLRLLHLVPAAIAFGAALLWNPLWASLLLFTYYLLIGFALSRFITASVTNAVFDKVINPHIPGAVVNRGLNTDVDDDDDDEN